MSKGKNLILYDLFINPKDVKELKSDIWCDDPIPASLRIQKKKYDIDIVYRGSHIREFPKKSYHIKFFYPSFYKGSKEIHLNAEYMDPSLMRSKLSFDFFTDIGVLSPEAQYVLLKINGVFQGIYLQIESVDEYFLAKRGLSQGSIYYAVDDDANFSLMSELDNDVKKSLLLGYERKHGSDADDLFLEEFIYKVNVTPRKEFENVITNYVDVDKYLHWLAGIVCTQNYDGFVHNYALYKNGETDLFEMIPWDYDATWGRDVNGRSMPYDYVRIQGFNTLSARILDVDLFKEKYFNIMKSILDSKYTVEFLEPKVMDLYNQLRPHILTDPYKKNSIVEFDQEPAEILQFIKERNSYLRGKLKELI